MPRFIGTNTTTTSLMVTSKTRGLGRITRTLAPSSAFNFLVSDEEFDSVRAQLASLAGVTFQASPVSSPFKNSVRMASTTNIASLSGLKTIDTVVGADGDRVLLKDQTDKTQNGIWIMRTAAWERAADAASSGDMLPDCEVWVSEGSAAPTGQADSCWILTTDAPIVIGTTQLTFARGAGLAGSVASDVVVNNTTATDQATTATNQSATAVNQSATATNQQTEAARLVTFAAPAAADGDGVHALYAADQPNTFPGPITSPVIPRNLTVTFEAGWDGGDVSVSGTDQTDVVLNEVFTSTPGSTVTGVKTFKTVTDISKGQVGATTNKASVGWGDKIGLYPKPADANGMLQVDAVGDVVTVDPTSVARGGFTPTTLPNGARNYSLVYNVNHNHVQDAHNHTQNSHNHVQDAHTHVQNAHTHTLSPAP